VKFCGEKGCGKKMAAFRRGSGWKYVCPDAPQHARDKLAADTAKKNRGGVKKGTPSPLLGRELNKPHRYKWKWGAEKKPKKK
jgi:hypothetical protein